ncbi:sulfate adenylyltransferase subunit CysN [Roseomonas eburnea]|uniref:Multifunctional fusion protein n=1 Tax=Neoroseomonas eburnea TaxID=1346889 RepID=A0A9X9X9B0_9PROT|nr:sulfate adenylyltransferase subunit CysN [Neoroseomonas eburnea]MBR0680296.1 sulfate adenylyltransferase subunit CysN [Neoroseomonas eburnea]
MTLHRKLGQHELLRFLTCGSVDDGKSTLIGRLLYDSQLIFEDTLVSLAKDSRKHGTTGDEIDLALLVDGLEAERQQGITIDVAYRFFATPRRSFIVADTPGHEQYTRNMATGASGASLAVILIDARKGVLTQTRRHSYICSLLGIRDIVVAVNKIDLVNFSEDTFDRIVGDYVTFASELGFRSVVPVPISARFGDNVTQRSGNMPWYHGPTLLEHLETVDVTQDLAGKPFRFPVQWVNRPNLDFRGFAGTIAAGRIAPGDQVVVAASGKTSRIARIVTADGDLPSAEAGQAVTLTLEDEVDVARGDILVRPAERPPVADQFAAHLLWMDEEAMLPGRGYLMRIGNIWTPCSVTSIRHRVDVNTLEEHAARRLALNEIGFCNFSAGQAIPLDPYEESRATGAFILVDRFTNRTAGAGMVAYPLRRASNIHHEHFSVDKTARAALVGNTPMVLWFTGLSGSGKSTIANIVEQALHRAGRPTYSLDGDNIRHGLCRDLGFTAEDRVENIRRVGEVAKLFVDAGMIVLCSFISPFQAERRMVRDLLGPGEFVEIFVDTPIEACIQRDPKGLYARAQAGQIKNFTGIDSPYEAPEHPELHIRTAGRSPEECSAEVLDRLRAAGIAC